jgi:hypothetical protein
MRRAHSHQPARADRGPPSQAAWGTVSTSRSVRSVEVLTRTARRRVRLRVLPRDRPARRVRLPAVPARRPRLPECHRDTWLSHESTLCHTPTSFAPKPCTSIPAMSGPDGDIGSLLHASARHCDSGARADPISHYSFGEHLSLHRSRQYVVVLSRQSFASCPFQRKALRHHVRRLVHLAPQLA